MKDLTFVSSSQLETLEQFAASLLTGVISLKSLEGYHIAAYKKGLMSDDEQETSKTICWEIHRLLALYKQLIEMIQERAPINEKQVYADLKAMMPGVVLRPKREKKK